MTSFYYIASHPYLYLPAPQLVHLLRALPPSSLTKHLNSVFLSNNSWRPHTQSPPNTPPAFSTFRPSSESEISRILHNLPNKQSDSDPIPTSLIRQCSSVLIPVITGSAVALHCCKAHERINRKTGNSTPCKIVTPENFSSNVCTGDYIGDGNYLANFCENRFSGGFSPNR